MSQGQGRHIGTLIVVILKARNLPNKRHIGKQDPYCQVVFNGEKRRTKAIKRGGQHPEWDEEIRFELYEDTGDDLPQVPGAEPPPPPPKSNGKGPPKVKGGNFMALACYAEDVREPDLIGETKVDLTEVLTKGETDEWFTIMYKDKYCGEVYLELTFWLDEPPPVKKANPKPTNGQYGGRGTFVPLGESASSSLTDLSRYGSTNSRDEIRRENLPPSLRSSNSRLDIYVAPYETTRSHSSSVDGIASEFAELSVNHGNRRLSMPVHPTGGSYLPRAASATPPESAYSSQSSHSLHQSTYSDGSQTYAFDSSPGRPQPYHHDSAPLPDPYQPAYEQAATPAPSAFQHGHRPRYSLPPQSSGFMPLPQPSGFVPLNSSQPAPSGFLPPPSVTPTPTGYGAVGPARVPSSSFSTLPPAQSGFAQGPPPSSSYPSVSQPSSLYYPPSQQNPPPSSTPYPQSQYSLPPSSSFPQHQPPPTSSYSASTPPASSFPHSASTPPASSFSHNPLPSSSYPQLPPPPPPASAPASQQQQQHQQAYSLSPSTPGQSHHPYSATPEQSPHGYGHHSPSFDNIPPPPPLSDSPSGGHTGSRPLPQPQSQSRQSPQPQHARRQSSLPVPPGPPPQGYYNGTQNGPPSFPSATPYQSIPPPPPLPGQVPPPPPPQSSFSHGQQLALSGPAPQLSSSMSLPQQPSTQAPPKRRPSLPAPPVTYQQQQSMFQSLPPPPPPPSMPSHMQYEPPTSSFGPPGQNQGYYPPGPPPRPPQYLPGPPQPTQGGWSSPVSQPDYGYGQ
ncbi:hypothetical protein BD311DRAFT_862948 [Dichomitus squalens]|uniref:C2 domain-containing protein n=1 Tax=Dichomitus squalens TaxID=114155 RepID=A0A4Q9MVZ9_9APHY|nr:hypothetical protein BD311DRAFT_862948 [Dichomitus squalens]